MSNIPPPSEPKANKKITLVSVRLSDEELKLFEETARMYRSRHSSRHPKRGITYSDVLRAAIETLRIKLKEELVEELNEKVPCWNIVPDVTDDNFDDLEDLTPNP